MTVIDCGALKLVSGRDGLFLVNPRDFYIGQALMTYGEFSIAEARLFREILRPGSMVLEIGANIGGLTVPLARHVGPSGRVIAVEPQRVIFQNLCANVALNGLFNVECRQIAAGARRDILNVPPVEYGALGNFGGVELSADTVGEPVEVIPVDEFFRHDHLAMVKIDVEGMEAEVLAGAEATIGRFQPVLYVENDRPEKSPALIERIHRMDYRCWWHFPPMFNPNNAFANPDNIYPGLVSINMLCLPRKRPANVPLLEVTDPEYWPMP